MNNGAIFIMKPAIYYINVDHILNLTKCFLQRICADIYTIIKVKKHRKYI